MFLSPLSNHIPGSWVLNIFSLSKFFAQLLQLLFIGSKYYFPVIKHYLLCFFNNRPTSFMNNNSHQLGCPNICLDLYITIYSMSSELSVN